VDERAGSRAAHDCGISTIGTLGILLEAGYENLIDFHVAIESLTTKTAFRHSKVLIDSVVADFEKERSRRANRQ
jgi:predicted nucleic acid-binding protein